MEGPPKGFEMHGLILFLHILAATIWTGGHLVLCLRILPQALKSRSVTAIREFEATYEVIGIPALIFQVLSGFWLAAKMVPMNQWLNLDNPLTHPILLKLLLLGLTALLGLHARLWLIPNLTPKTLNQLAWHILGVTTLAVFFVFAGVSFRTGWLW